MTEANLFFALNRNLRPASARPALMALMALPLAVALSPSPSRAEVVIHRSYNPYPIHGTTPATIDQDLALKGPQARQTGQSHPGLTRMNFDGAATYRPSTDEGTIEEAKTCRIEKVTITLDLTIILPEWQDRAQADKGTIRIWDALSSDIRRHEDHHAEIATRHAQALERKILALTPMPTCKALQAKVAVLTRTELAQHDRDQQAFDRAEAASFQSRMMKLLRNRQ